MHKKETTISVALALAFIVIVTLCTSCLCVIPGVNATIGCLPPGYSLYYTPPDQSADKQGEEGAVYPYNEKGESNVQQDSKCLRY